MKITLREAFYYLFIVFVMLYYSFRRVNMDYSMFEIFLYFAIPFLIAKVYMTKYTMREAIMILLLGSLGCYSAIAIDNTALLIAFCVIIGMKNIDYVRVLKIIFWMRLFVTLYVLIAVQFGWILDDPIMRGGEYRYSMGYAHPNTFGFYCFVLVSLWFIVYGKEKWKLKWVISFVVAFVQYYYTKSNTSIILLLLFLFFILIYKIGGQSIVFKKVAYVIYPVVAILNCITPLLVNTSIFIILDRMLNSRLTLSVYYMNNYGIGLLAKDIPTIMDTNSYLYLDSGYLNLFIRFGLIIGVVILGLFMDIIRKLSVEHTYVFIAVIIMAIYASIENVLYSMLFNYFFVLAGAAFYRQLKGKESKGIVGKGKLDIGEYK